MKLEKNPVKDFGEVVMVRDRPKISRNSIEMAIL